MPADPPIRAHQYPARAQTYRQIDTARQYHVALGGPLETIFHLMPDPLVLAWIESAKHSL
jgi:hypothetical protein